MPGLTIVITHATGDVYPASDWNTYNRDNVNYLIQAGAALASAATLVPTNEFHTVTGSTTIDNITPAIAAVAGQKVRLLFQATTTVRHNGGGTGNIRLAAGLHAGFVANETLTLHYDGTNWIEETRSPKHLSGEEVVMSHAAMSSVGYPVEDGSAISRTTFAALFANQGTIHGVGDGSTTFNLADKRGRVTVAYAPSGGHTDVSTVGLNDGGAVAFRRAKHRHQLPDHKHGITNISDIPNSGVATSGGDQPGETNALSTFIGGNAGLIGNSANDALDAPSYIVKPTYVRI